MSPITRPQLPGSNTNLDIAAELTAQGFEDNKAEVRMPECPFKVVGEFSVTLPLHPDVATDVNVVVVGEQ